MIHHQYGITVLLFLRCHLAAKPVVVLRIACEQALWRALQRGGKRKESLQLCFWNLNICINSMRNVDWQRWHWWWSFTSFSMCAFAFVSALCWLAEIWQLSQQGATRELEARFKFQRRSSKLSFLFLPHRQNPRESALRLCWEMSGYLVRLHP